MTTGLTVTWGDANDAWLNSGAGREAPLRYFFSGLDILACNDYNYR